MSAEHQTTSNEDIRALVERLSRSDRKGGRTIERAAIMAEGANSAAILEWLDAEHWTPEAPIAETAHRGGSGLHGMRREAERGSARAAAPRRYISPAGDSGI